MAIATVVLTHGGSRIAEPDRLPVTTVTLPEFTDAEQWSEHTALALHESALRGGASGPLLLVLDGERAALAPRLGFAQRAARRAVAGYLLIDPELPRVGEVADWPDAPVTVVVTPEADDDVRAAALQARLRGWDTHEGDPLVVLASLCSQL